MEQILNFQVPAEGLEMSNFAMGTILGKGFPQAQVHTVHSTSAEGTSKC